MEKKRESTRTKNGSKTGATAIQGKYSAGETCKKEGYDRAGRGRTRQAKSTEERRTKKEPASRRCQTVSN
ncbi:MAG: hypothetical protein D5R99_02160 [Methanocalculus sp. MSAO_Arc1]|nr:MAG: hypothetical protein D5R99_02160 [Methanocalculus sp. MSAO_Arc1]